MTTLPSSPDPQVGARLGSFQLEAKIGDGGFGVVYRAMNLDLQRMVALKVFKGQADQCAINRVLKEARAISRVESDHVVTIHSLGEDRGRVFIEMELLSGETLAQRLRTTRMSGVRLPLLDALCIARDAADAVVAVHVCSLAHRDLKPANIFLAERPHGREILKLLDFGLAKVVGDDAASMTQQGLLKGTLGYFAPEVVDPSLLSDDEDMNPQKADQFALGVILFEMLTGERLFRIPRDGTMKEKQAAVLYQIVHKPVPSLLGRELGENCERLEPLVRRALQKRPEHRFETVKAFHMAIENEIQKHKDSVLAEGEVLHHESAQVIKPRSETAQSHQLSQPATGPIEFVASAEILDERTGRFSEPGPADRLVLPPTETLVHSSTEYEYESMRERLVAPSRGHAGIRVAAHTDSDRGLTRANKLTIAGLICLMSAVAIIAAVKPTLTRRATSEEIRKPGSPKTAAERDRRREQETHDPLPKLPSRLNSSRLAGAAADLIQPDQAHPRADAEGTSVRHPENDSTQPNRTRRARAVVSRPHKDRQPDAPKLDQPPSLQPAAEAVEPRNSSEDRLSTPEGEPGRRKGGPRPSSASIARPARVRVTFVIPPTKTGWKLHVDDEYVATQTREILLSPGPHTYSFKAPKGPSYSGRIDVVSSVMKVKLQDVIEKQQTRQ